MSSKAHRGLINKKGTMLLAIAAAVIIASVATAAATDTNTIIACKANSNGALRVVAASSDCKNNELAVTWNQVGPQGPAGPAGQQGAAGADGAKGADSTVPGPAGSKGDPGATGPAGPTGATGATGAAGTAILRRVTSTQMIPPNTSFGFTIPCGQDEFAITGGFRTDFANITTSYPEVPATDNGQPNYHPNGYWIVQGVNSSVFTANVTGYAYCAPAKSVVAG